MARVEFTKEMRGEYTILFPDMAPIHFQILRNVFRQHGYRTELLTNSGDSVVQEGLKYVHNDTCYPALLVIGQMIDALKSGKYDLHKTALLITQTGGGCRASNYIFLLRKALERAGMEYVPVVSLNFAGLEKNAGFKLTLPLLLKALAAVLLGDELMLLRNQVRPYECVPGESDRLVDEWVEVISNRMAEGWCYKGRGLKRTFREVAESFGKIQRVERRTIKVGVVGEIYVKYAKLANNDLEGFLQEQGCEVNVPGVMGFLLYCVDNGIQDKNLYGGSFWKAALVRVAEEYLSGKEKLMTRAVRDQGFHAPGTFKDLKRQGQEIIGPGCKMGEGWLLTAEMVELVESGFVNIVCTQPFGCLPNHIAGKGMIRKIREKYPQSNIVPIDYDPGATRVNQENRIKLMLAVAREAMDEAAPPAGERELEPAGK